jgi:hypothetical protein
MQAWVAFTVTALRPRRDPCPVPSASTAASARYCGGGGQAAPVLFDWRASQGFVQVIYLISALCVVSAILSYLD